MLLLALAAWGPEQRQLMAELAEGIMSRQRGDGSFHVSARRRWGGAGGAW